MALSRRRPEVPEVGTVCALPRKRSGRLDRIAHSLEYQREARGMTFINENPPQPNTGSGLYECAGTARLKNTTLAEALAAHGLTLPENAEPGKLVRMPGAGKRPS